MFLQQMAGRYDPDLAGPQAAGTIVSDYTALLSGRNWNGVATGRSAFITYSFESQADTAVYQAAGLETSLINSFRAFSSTERAFALQALGIWGDATGITFLEADPGQGDIRFGAYNFDLSIEFNTSVGFAYYPTVSLFSAASAFQSSVGGDVFIDTGFLGTSSEISKVGVLLHELGHALGFKHPFDGTPILSAAFDNKSNTVMSYQGTYPAFALGPLDIQAGTFTYGTAGADGSHAATWSWDAATDTLTQQALPAGGALRGVGGRNIMLGGSGNDFLLGNLRDDTLAGSPGADTLVGAEGYDTADFSGATLPVTVEMWRGDGGFGVISVTDGTGSIDQISGFEALIGGAAGDILTGDSVGNLIQSLGGNDTLNGGGGNDYLDGGADDDSIAGAGGADTVLGGNGNDTLFGGQTFAAADLADWLLGGEGNDRLAGGAGGDTLTGGAGFDTANFTGATGAVTAELWRADAVTGMLFANDGLGFVDQLGGIEALIGGEFGDYLSGDSSGNLIQSSGGNDTLNGGFGDDYLDGGAQADYLFGSVGADTVLGGAGDDTIFGGGAGATAGDLADWLLGAEGADFLIGEVGNDTLDGGLDSDFLVGGYFGTLVSGNDSLTGSDGFDTLLGEDGDDTLDGGNQDDFIIGGTGNDSIRGGDGNDILVADGFGSETGNDTIDGGLGNDVIIGGLGSDRYTGGGGNDQFWLTLTAGQSSGTKTISDYDLVNDVVVIDAVNPAALTFAAIQGQMTQTGANVTLNLSALGHPTTTLIFENRTIAQLQANDFVVF